MALPMLLSKVRPSWNPARTEPEPDRPVTLSNDSAGVTDLFVDIIDQSVTYVVMRSVIEWTPLRTSMSTECNQIGIQKQVFTVDWCLFLFSSNSCLSISALRSTRQTRRKWPTCCRSLSSLTWTCTAPGVWRSTWTPCWSRSGWWWRSTSRWTCSRPAARPTASSALRSTPSWTAWTSPVRSSLTRWPIALHTLWRSCCRRYEEDKSGKICLSCSLLSCAFMMQYESSHITCLLFCRLKRPMMTISTMFYLLSRD